MRAAIGLGGWRADTVAMCLALPAVLGAVFLVLLEGYRLARPESVLFKTATHGTFAEALRVGEVEAAHAFVRAGADPNAPIAFRDPELTAGRDVLASPLLVAVAAENGSAALMLLAFGARMDLPQNALAACLARDVGVDDLADAILRHGRPQATPACPAPPSPGGGESAPLLRYLPRP